MNPFRRHVGKGVVTIQRNRPAKPRLHGYVLDASDTLALVHVFHDFYPEGYEIIRVRDVVDVRSGPNEKHWDRMLRGEKRVGGLRLRFRPDLSSLRAALESVITRYYHIIIECEARRSANTEFYIGTASFGMRGPIAFHHFDARGQWETKLHSIKAAEITTIGFDTPYIRHFSKYLSDEWAALREIAKTDSRVVVVSASNVAKASKR